jgi:hypothetical protein
MQQRSRRSHLRGALLTAGMVGLIAPGAALAHLERPSYWPDPAPDTSVSPPAGGGVPTARSLDSAVTGEGPGAVRIVCKQGGGANSLALANQSIAQASNRGFRLRPSQPVVKLTKAEADRLRHINIDLWKQCRYSSIQKAVNASGNNDRVVIMPGRYTEPESRKAPLNDPKCNPSLLQADASGDLTPSYQYQATCPNDQNLIYVQGRAIKGTPLPTPRADRRGIPAQELGPCVRCNLQIEGSGPKPEDVVIDAGSDYQGPGIEAKPLTHGKHVVLRVDRADGFVGRNFLVRGALEFGFYVEETDGVLLDRTKFFWNADYGHLSFTTDHNLVMNCDGMGSGDSVVYPGAAPETGSQRTSFYPDAPRDNTTIKRCDLRNSALGYSGSMGNAVRITENNIYGNATGISSDTLSAAGHPGFPADSSHIDHNWIYANNFDVFDPNTPVDPLVGVPIGAGVIYPGMNDARVHDNWFFDNWRYGVFQNAVPTAFVNGGGAEGAIFPGISCAGAPANGLATSCGNRYYGNRMGQVPPGFTFPEPLDRFGVPHSPQGASRMPNGTDFWWDEFSTNRWNCWYGNTGVDGTPGSVTGPGDAGRTPAVPPNVLPDCANGTNPNLSVGGGDSAKLVYLIDCADGPDEDTGPLDCDWWQPPLRPGSAALARRAKVVDIASRTFDRTPAAAQLRARVARLTLTPMR